MREGKLPVRMSNLRVDVLGIVNWKGSTTAEELPVIYRNGELSNILPASIEDRDVPAVNGFCLALEICNRASSSEFVVIRARLDGFLGVGVLIL